MPLQATSGAASYDAFGGGVPFEPIYIEQVFQNWLYTGNGSTQTINNGIDLAGKGGLVWQKMRSDVASHLLTDTVRGSGYALVSNSTGAQVYNASIVSSFNSNGFTDGGSQASGATYASWTFREQPKFFDVVTYTGNGASTITINHNLGSVPGCVFIKNVSATSMWNVFHRSLAANQVMFLNGTDAVNTMGGATGGNIVLGATSITVPGNSTANPNGSTVNTNTNGQTYVAYLFAHNAGGFGLTGTDNVISCGSYTGNGSATGPVIDLGYEPQWLLVKNASFGTANWLVYDNMRGLPVGSNPSWLYPNTSAAEVTDSWGRISPTATGFQVATADAWLNQSGNTIIYIAIRRGPMKTPTTGTSVFDPELTAAATGTTVTTNFPIDLQLYRATGVLDNTYVVDRLRGVNTTAVNTSTPRLFTSTTGAESTDAVTRAWDNTGFQTPLSNGGVSSIYWNFRRAPGFFDVVCFDEATAPTSALPHNLTVVPELVIYKKRSGTSNWITFTNLDFNKYLRLNTTDALAAGPGWSATSTTVDLSAVTGSGTAVAYLFASCPGVSKVFSYTGNGSSQTINCGFTGGARFVMIKRTDSTGDWYVWDTARGIVANNDPHLSLNSTAAEVTTNDTIDTDSTGFVVNQVSATNVNVSSATYIGLAIA